MQRNHVTIRPLNREDSVLYFPPEAFGPFRVLHQIGAGTLGPVFRAYEPGRDRLVAIKVFRLDLTPEQSAALVGHLQALIAAGINHPNIAAPIAAGLESGAVYLAQEYAVGDSLDVVLRERGPMSIEDAEPLVDCACRRHRFCGVARRASRLAASSRYHSGCRRRAHHRFRDRRGAEEDLGEVADATAVRIRPTARPTCTRSAPSRSRWSPASAPRPRTLEEFAAAPRVTAARRACGAALRTIGSRDPLRAVIDRTPQGPSTSARRTRSLIAPELDLRIDPRRAIDGRIQRRSAATVPSQSARALCRGATPAPGAGRSWRRFWALPSWRRRPSGIFLQSPTPVATRDPKAASRKRRSISPKAAPSTRRRPTPRCLHALPAPTPSRPASGAVAGSQKPERGSLLIRSSPADADVLVNGRARGKTPLTLRDLDARIVYDSCCARRLRDRGADASGDGAPADCVGDVHASRNARFRSRGRARPGALNVQSRPAGARVFVNDRLVGSTPLALPDLPAGPATVRIELDGYRPWTTTVQIGAGEQTSVAASLERQ